MSQEKFPDFKGFIDKIHKIGMKIALWFPIPFVGFDTKAYKFFKDKLLYEQPNVIRAGVLDPRYKEVREFIIKSLLDIFVKYDLDGLKLDFIDSFWITDSTPQVNNKMDMPNLQDAIQTLLSEINNEMLAIKEDALIEYRQNYVGPAITQYTNMLRVADCAFDSITNRIAINDMRLLKYDLAIHSDMLYWKKDESNENVATQLNNILFGVPQISVLLTEDSEEHLRVLKNYITYWKENRHLLMNSDLFVEGMESNYSSAYVENDNKKIIALYSSNYVKCDNKEIDILNASNSEYLIIESEYNKKAYSYNSVGEIIEEIDIKVGLNKIEFKRGGKVIVK